MEPVKLYIASSVGELNKKGNYEFDPSRSMKIHINHSEATFKSAEEARSKKDEERAYVLYMRYIDIYQKVKKSRDFKKDPTHYSLLLGTRRVTEAISHAEVLSGSLKKRYDEAKVKTEAFKKDPESDHMKPNGILLSSQKNSSSQEGPASKMNVISPGARSISCEKLRRIRFAKSSNDYKVLIIDIRDEDSFRMSRIQHEDCINIPRRLLTPGTICMRIDSGITNAEHLKLWKRRAEYDVLVMIDWFCEEKNLDDLKHPLRSLFDALHKWEQTIFLSRAPVVMSGGFADWIEFYPQLTTNPKIQVPKKEKPEVVSITSLSDVDFSSLLTPNANSETVTVSDGISNDVAVSAIDEPNKSNDLLSQDKPGLTDVDFFSTWKVSDASEIISKVTYMKQDSVELPKERLLPKTGIPTVNRSTKPGSENGSAAAKDAQNSNFFSESKDSKRNRDEISDLENRLLEARKKKEEDERKRIDLEEKMKKLELAQEAEKVEREAAEEEIRRKLAERDLAMKMRNLRPSQDSLANQSTVPNEDSRPNPTSVIDPIHIQTKTDTPVPKPGPTSQPDPATCDSVAATTKFSAQDSKADANSKIPPKNEKSSVKAEEDSNVSDLSPVTKNSHIETPPIPQVKPKTQQKSTKKTESVPKPHAAISNSSTSIKKSPIETTPDRQVQPNIIVRDAKKVPEKTPHPQLPSRDTKPVVLGNDTNVDVKPDSSIAPKASVQARRPLPVPKPSSQPASNSAKKESTVRSNNKVTLSTSLPMNWEKRLDAKTGRYFYLDHKTQTTHWNLPSHVDVKRRANTVKLKDEPSGPSGGLKRSSSTPNIAQLVDEQAIPDKPMVNRSKKPSLKDQAIKDLSDNPDVYAQKLSQLHPNYGARGPGQCGLYNLGNTCYMNSVLQCMFSTCLLAEYFLNNVYKNHLNRENFLGSGGEITDGFAMLMKAVWNGKFKSVTPRDFRNTIGRFNSRFSSYSQQDSQELLLFLMDGLHEDLNQIKVREYKEEPDNEGKVDSEAARMSWEFHKRLNESIIVELFQGQFKAVTQCLSCRKTSRKFDVFMYLSLPLPNRGSCSITDCLDKFSEAEKLSGDNQWFCPNCKQDRDAIRKLEIWKLPPVLLIHFKRFSFSGRWGDKLQTNVKFPVNDLDVNKYVKGPKKGNAFNLYAVSHHYGATMDSGHYVATCKNPTDGAWYKFDDHEVSKASLPSGSSAYILCYSSLGHTMKVTGS